MPRSTLSILIPLYNEEGFIQNLLEQVLNAALPDGVDREIIVVNDCSTDGSAEAVQDFLANRPEQVRLVHHPKNMGKGAAIRTAIGYATGEFTLIQDADLEYDPREYQKLLAPLRAAKPM